MATHRRDCCRYCGHDFPAWFPVGKRPDRTMLLQHLGQQHPDQVGPYLEWMRPEDISTVAAEAYEVVDG